MRQVCADPLPSSRKGSDQAEYHPMSSDRHLDLGFVLSYRAPKYIRMLTLRDALSSLPGVRLHDSVNEARGYVRYWQTLKKIIRLKAKVNPAAWVVNFRGHEIYWLLRLIAGRRAKLVFDELVSPYDAFVNERRTFPASSVISKMVYLVERSILANADLVLTDSIHQAEYYARLFRVPAAKMRVVPGSVDEAVFTPQAPPRKYDYAEPFVIFTYGTFIPLQGMELLLEAAELVKDLPARFLIAGGKGKKLDRFLEIERERDLTNISHVEWINFAELPSYMRGASLCLGGPFGGTNQAMRVITGKALQFLACACPTVVGLSAETRALFTDREDCLLVEQGSPAAIAEAIRWAYAHPQALADIGARGRRVYEQRYSMAVLKSNVAGVVEELQAG